MSFCNWITFCPTLLATYTEPCLRRGLLQEFEKVSSFCFYAFSTFSLIIHYGTKMIVVVMLSYRFMHTLQELFLCAILQFYVFIFMPGVGQNYCFYIECAQKVFQNPIFQSKLNTNKKFLL